MRYWWVNQNRTHRHELAGGYLWSPKRKANGERNSFYEFMREVSPGDLVFSFVNTFIVAIGVSRSFAYEAPKPAEFGSAGRNWDDIGWRVDVRFTQPASRLRPADWIDRLRPLLPQKYSPLLQDGRGVQSIYLTELPRQLALVLADLICDEVGALARAELVSEVAQLETKSEVLLWEDHLREKIVTLSPLLIQQL